MSGGAFYVGADFGRPGGDKSAVVVSRIVNGEAHIIGRIVTADHDGARWLASSLEACAGLADPSVVPELVAFVRKVATLPALAERCRDIDDEAARMAAVRDPLEMWVLGARALLARTTEPPQRHRANPDPAEAPHLEDRP